jgi:hypothetical protein
MIGGLDLQLATNDFTKSINELIHLFGRNHPDSFNRKGLNLTDFNPSYPNTPPILLPASRLIAKRQTAPSLIRIRPRAAASFTEPPIQKYNTY